MAKNKKPTPKNAEVREALEALAQSNEKPDLDTEASTWLPEQTEPRTGPATLVTDPFRIHTREISEIQDSSDELDLDEPEDEETLPDESETPDPEKVVYDLASLAKAMRDEESRNEKELTETVEESQAELQAAADRLAQEIAEDKALHLEEKANEEKEVTEDPELEAALPSEPKVDESGNLDLSELQSCIEAILFMTDKPMSAEKMQSHLGQDIPFPFFQEALTSLRDRYSQTHHGFEIVEVAGGFQFRTKPGRAALAKKLSKIQVQRLSTGAMETLAIVAYRQPVLKDEIDKIRGVDSSHFVRTLLDRKLIQISGRSDLPGRPMVYTTTTEFLELFGLKSAEDLPSLREIEQMIPSSEARAEDEDPRVREMRRLVGEMKAHSHSILDYDPKEDEKLLKEIREKVSAIPTSTPYLDEQKALEKAHKAGLVASPLAESEEVAPELPLENKAAHPLPEASPVDPSAEDERISPD